MIVPVPRTVPVLVNVALELTRNVALPVPAASVIVPLFVSGLSTWMNTSSELARSTMSVLAGGDDVTDHLVVGTADSDLARATTGVMKGGVAQGNVDVRADRPSALEEAVYRPVLAFIHRE